MKKSILLIAALFLSHATLAATEIIIPGPSDAKSTHHGVSQQPKALSRFFANTLFHNVSDPFIGNKNGSAVLAEFFDYQCIHCIAMSSVLSDLAQKNPNLKVVFKIYSLGRSSSTRAALAAIASEKQGKFLDFHHALLTANQPLNDEVIFKIAQSVGLNVDQLKIDMESAATDSKLKANMQLAQDLKIPGTPAIFVTSAKHAGKQDVTSYFVGEVSPAGLQDAINKAAR